jgi:hypothetical protein
MPHRKATHCKYCTKLARENARMRHEMSILRLHLVSMDTQRQEVVAKLQSTASAIQLALLAMRSGSHTYARTTLEGTISA